MVVLWCWLALLPASVLLGGLSLGEGPVAAWQQRCLRLDKMDLTVVPLDHMHHPPASWWCNRQGELRDPEQSGHTQSELHASLSVM